MRSYTTRVAVWIVLYLFFILAPLFALLAGSLPPTRDFWTEFSVAIGYAGLAMMGLQFENLVLNSRRHVHELLRIDPQDIINENPFYQRKTQRHAGCQIDSCPPTPATSRNASCSACMPPIVATIRSGVAHHAVAGASA